MDTNATKRGYLAAWSAVLRNHVLVASAGIIVTSALLPASALAGVTILFANGTVSELSQVADCPNALCFTRCRNIGGGPVNTTSGQMTFETPDCTFAAPGDETKKASANATVTVSATQSSSGDQQTITFKTFAGTGTASYALTDKGSAFVQVQANFDIEFLITGQAETVTIEPSFNVGGSQRQLFARLEGPSGVVGEFFKEPSTGADTDTLPRSISLPPSSESYAISAGFTTDAIAGCTAGDCPQDPSVNLDMTLTVTIGNGGGEFHWTNPQGGDFAVAGSWNPQQVPTFDAQRSDTAIFDLPGNPLVQIQAANNSVGRWIVRHMGVGLEGPAQVLGTSTDKSRFIVDDGGKLLLESGNTFSTNDGVVGDETGAESGVLVASARTLWKVLGPLVIGRRAPGKVIVDEDGALDAQDSITLGNLVALGTGGTLHVGGALEVDDGGHVTTPNLTLNEGSLQVRGRGAATDSLLQVASVLDIGGENGTGSVVIEGGGGITAQKVLVGDRAGTGGETITISGLDSTGSSSTLDTDGELHVAGNAATQIEVKDGGTLSTSGAAHVGDNLAVGKVIVHGKSGTTRASWDAFDDVSIGGQLVASQLAVADGGRVTAAKNMVLGAKSGEIGSVSVSDVESRLNVDTLVVGGDGRGELTIFDGRVKSRLGKVGQRVTPAAPGARNGSGVVTIEGSSAQWHVTGDCAVGVDEPGIVSLVSQPLLGGGKLLVDGTLDVFPQGTISGSGMVTAGRVSNHGSIAPSVQINSSSMLGVTEAFNQGPLNPGVSAGRIVIEGDYEQSPDGVLTIEAAGVGPGQLDVLDVTGDATLGGKIELRFIDGYLPKAGDHFDFLEIGGTAGGRFDDVEIAGVAHGFAHELSTTGGVIGVAAKSDAHAASCADPDDRDHDGALGCNFLANPGMEENGGSATLPRGWVSSNATTDRRKCNHGSKVFAHTGRCAYQLVGRADPAAHELEQTLVGLVGEAGRRLTFAAWARGRKIPSGAKPKIELALLSSGAVVKRSRLSLASGSYGYKRFARTFTVPSAYDEVQIRIRYAGTSGNVLVDDLNFGVE